MPEVKNPLKKKPVYEILDGDKKFSVASLDEEVGLPYLSGRKLVDILNHFGCAYEYGSESRWMYVEKLIDHCSSHGILSEMFEYIFELGKFSDLLRGKPVDAIQMIHRDIVSTAVSLINGELLFSGYELVDTTPGFSLRKIGVAPKTNAPAIKSIDRPYVKRISERAHEEIESGNFDSALTKSRTLLEEVFCYVIEKKGETPSSKGDIGKLYTQVKNLYNMHANGDLGKRINTLLSGLEKIVSSVAEMRNASSDAHGVGQARIEIKDYHARLMVNASMNMADFILSVANATSQNTTKENNDGR